MFGINIMVHKLLYASLSEQPVNNAFWFDTCSYQRSTTAISLVNSMAFGISALRVKLMHHYIYACYVILISSFSCCEIRVCLRS